MKKIIRDVDEKRGIVQVTTSDERWYIKPGRHPDTNIPAYVAVPSVTWIAGYWPKGVGFYKWLADKGWDEAEAVKQAAGDKGSRVHLALEMILSGQEFRIDTRVEDKSKSTEGNPVSSELTYEELLCVKSFLDWRADLSQHYDLKTLATETTVFSEYHGYAGTVDWVVMLTPKASGKNPLELEKATPFIIDFKTSKQVWKEYELQISAYRRTLINGENPIKELNDNGTETGKDVDLVHLRTAILQLGYDKNKMGYKFTEIEDSFDLFQIARQIWQAEIGDNRPGFTQRDFPIVLSPAVAPVAVDPGANLTPESEAPGPRRKATTKTK